VLCVRVCGRVYVGVRENDSSLDKRIS